MHVTDLLNVMTFGWPDAAVRLLHSLIEADIQLLTPREDRLRSAVSDFTEVLLAPALQAPVVESVFGNSSG